MGVGWGDRDTLLIKDIGKKLQLPKSIRSCKKSVADMNHIQSENVLKHIYPISELGQNSVDY